MYAGDHEVFPSGQGGIGRSLFVSLLPYVEHSAHYDAFNFSHSIGLPSNDTAISIRPTVMVCPSDPLQPVWTSISYAGNCGDALYLGRYNGTFATTDSPWDHHVGPRDITDGTSNTAALAEWSIGLWGDADRTRSIYRPGAGVGGPVGPDQFAARCRSLDGYVPDMRIVRGRDWASGKWAQTLYDHFMSVNQHSCINGPGAGVVAACTVGSDHPGGANVVFADGRAAFVRGSVAPDIWHALGTRDGGELMPSDGY